MLPAINPALLKGKSQEAFNVLNKNIGITQVRPARTKKNYIFISRNIGDAENIHFDVYNKSGEMTEKFVLSALGPKQKGIITEYKTFRNKVMRPRDPLVSPDKDMTFQQKLRTRPVIVKRIESLLQAASEALAKKD